MTIISAGPARGFIISKPIHIKINGTDIEGIVYGCSYDITVEITFPFKNLSNGTGIMYLARGHYSFDGHYGDSRAEEMLAYLYRVGDYVSRKSEMLKKEFDEHLQQVEKVSKHRFTKNEFGRRRSVLKKMLRRGDVSNIQYQRWIGTMRKDVEQLESRIWRLEDQFWAAYFPMEISIFTREPIIDILNGKPLISTK